MKKPSKYKILIILILSATLLSAGTLRADSLPNRLASAINKVVDKNFASDNTQIDIALQHVAGKLYSNFSYNRPSEDLLKLAKLAPIDSQKHKKRVGNKDQPQLPKYNKYWELQVPTENIQRPKMDKILQRAVRVGLQKTATCWERVMYTKGIESGEILLHLTINPQGNIDRVLKLKDTIRHSELSKCVAETAKRIQLAQAPGERLIVKLPLEFHKS